VTVCVQMDVLVVAFVAVDCASSSVAAALYRAFDIRVLCSKCIACVCSSTTALKTHQLSSIVHQKLPALASTISSSRSSTQRPHTVMASKQLLQHSVAKH
jgi:hypothetical protein